MFRICAVVQALAWARGIRPKSCYPSHMSKRQHTIACATILLLATALRTWNLTHNPAWFSDEGTHLDIARHILLGNTRYLPINQSTLLFAKLPGFEYLLAAALRLFPWGMTTLRGLTATLNLVAIALLLPTETNRPISQYLPALFLTVLPTPVLYARFGFSYNLLTPLLLLIFLTLPKRPKLAALATGLALITDLWAVPVALVVVISLFINHRRTLPAAICLIALPGCIYVATHLLTVPDAFLFDANYTLSRVSGIPISAQLRTLQTNLTMLTRTQTWLIAGGLGLVFHKSQRLTAIALFWFPLLFIGRTTALFNLGLYYTIPLFPLACVGLSALFKKLLEWGSTTLPHRFTPAFRYLLIGLVFLATLQASISTAHAVTSSFHPDIAPFLIDASNAQSAATWLNANRAPDDVTIASPAIAWMLEGNSADFQHAAASVGHTTPHLPNNIPSDRFAFNPHYSNATWLIIDPLWHTWATHHVPEVDTILSQLSTYTLVHETATTQIYRLPER